MDKNVMFTYSITAEEYMMFRKAVGWAEFPLEQAQEGLNNSFICVIRKNCKPIALGRIVSDMGYVVYIADVIVLPEYQGQGYGRMIMEKLMETIKCRLKPGYKIMITLASALGKDKFYEKFGFESRPNDRFGPGMCQWIGG